MHLSQDFELRLLRRLWTFTNQFRKGKDASKVTRVALRNGMELLGVHQGCVAILTPGTREVEMQFSSPQDSIWDLDLLAAFIRGTEERIPAQIALGRLRRRGRMWGILAVRSPKDAFNWKQREALSAIATAASDILEGMDLERMREVRARIDCKILEQLRPKDLFYQVLHGLHSLIQYDHSASVLLYDPREATLEVVAEAITWKKGKSDKIGMKVRLPEPLINLLRSDVVYGYDRPDSVWEEWTNYDSVNLAQLLDDTRLFGAVQGAPPDRSVLCAPLATRDRVLGILKVAAKHSGSFGPFEAELIGQFLPHTSIALQNSQRAESLEQNLIQAERKHAMADLARGVAHDVNNALGAVLPLVQQMRAEAEAGEMNAPSLADDLAQIESSMQTSRRIFGGMLNFARGAAGAGANIKQAIENSRIILKESLERRGINVAVEIDTGLPSIPGSQADLEQLFLNLLTNARDAMPQGGDLAIAARQTEEAIQLLVEDTGVGIPAEHLSKIFDPFFSTKPDGNGLGLSICRSIVWQLQGKLGITSSPGKGTRVSVAIPINQGA